MIKQSACELVYLQTLGAPGILSENPQNLGKLFIWLLFCAIKSLVLRSNERMSAGFIFFPFARNRGFVGETIGVEMKLMETN